MQGIFISYRRQDSQSAAGRLADHIKEQMPGVPVFRDVETIEPGVDFVEVITRAVLWRAAGGDRSALGVGHRYGRKAPPGQRP
ncbi:MAG: toll/interleukin-1 receptor domain-containing protein [Thiobacillaceae bacterium]